MSVAPARAAPAPLPDFYRALWRWHFYAGLLVLPFLALLAITGAIYLFRDEIEAALYRDLRHVEAPADAAALAPSALVAAALAAHPGTALKYLPPPAPDASAQVVVQAEGARRAVHVDPYRGTVLGDLPERGTILWTVRELHSLAIAGPIANALIEVAGGWTVLLVLTGLYLWWPRGRGLAAFSLRRRSGVPRTKRGLWRDIHAVVGLYVGGLALFLALTGMPWSAYWGAWVNALANSGNAGYPAGVYTDVPMSDEHLHHVAPTSWSLEQARLPLSSGGDGSDIGLDAAVARFDALGLAPGYSIALPQQPAGVYSGTVYPDDLSRQRVVHLDRYSGDALVDASFADYGAGAQAMEWGINVHMGQEFGLANQLLMLGACVGILLLCVSAAIMWWQRRPAGSLGVPPLPRERRLLVGTVIILAIGGIVFPLTGLSLLVLVALDLAVTRGWRRRRAAVA